MHASELFDLSGEVALVTGASSGLGERFAEVLAAHGAEVVVAARRSDRLATLVERITAAGGKAHAIELDVADQGAIGRARLTRLRRFLVRLQFLSTMPELPATRRYLM